MVALQFLMVSLQRFEVFGLKPIHFSLSRKPRESISKGLSLLFPVFMISQFKAGLSSGVGFFPIVSFSTSKSESSFSSTSVYQNLLLRSRFSL